MWIRGQLRKGLVKADNFIIKETEKGFEITTVYSYCTIVHGIYSTQEKALKVLDMIEQSVSGFTDEEAAQFYNYGVFQMPTDEEVKQDELN